MKEITRIDYLEGVRGLSALIVVLSHFVVGFYPALYNGDLSQVNTINGIEVYISRSPLNVLYGGNVAVCIFFILSAYVLTYKYFISKNIEYLSECAIRRYFRLVLPVVFSVLVSYLFMKFSLYYNNQAALITKSDWWLGSFWSFIPNFMDMLNEGFIQVFFGHKASYNSSLWTMTFEFYGSLLVLALAALVGNRKNRVVIYFLMIIFFINTYYVAFILGLMLSDLFNSSPNKNMLNTENSSLLIVIGVVGLFFCSYPTVTNVEGTIYDIFSVLPVEFRMQTCHIIGAFLVIFTILNSEFLQNIFRKKIFLNLGKISFSMYLIHLTVIGSFSSYIFIKLEKYLTYKFNFLITISISMVIIFSVSIWITKYVDALGIKFSKKIYGLFIKKN